MKHTHRLACGLDVKVTQSALMVMDRSGIESWPVIIRGLKPRTKADFDAYLDTLLAGIRMYASEMGLDPLPLPDYTESLSIVSSRDIANQTFC
uniref:Uncharacterized protein n=1 Tax=Timema cristinae TaxID=61476 RepID=A0A7R9HDI8_TIMCR|nr:unnamed protein product [Timema cristinae]